MAVGVGVFGFLCYLAFRGSAPATGLVVTAVALVVLVGGGNWLGGRSTPHGAPPGPPSSRLSGVDLPEGGIGPADPAGPGPGAPAPVTGRGPGGGDVAGGGPGGGGAGDGGDPIGTGERAAPPPPAPPGPEAAAP